MPFKCFNVLETILADCFTVFLKLNLQDYIKHIMVRSGAVGTENRIGLNVALPRAAPKVLYR
jgi:hypothetical protein